MIHGADIWTYGDENLIDFSSNINPLGYPEGLREFLFSQFDNVKRYPDIKYRLLKDNLSKYLKISSKNIIAGNGAMELIDLIISRYENIIIPYPSFVEYEIRANIRKINMNLIPPKKDLSLDIERILKEIRRLKDKNGSIIIGNPNNPNGYAIDYSHLTDIHSACMESEVDLILDEAFFEYAELDYDTVEYAESKEFKNIIIIRAATKFFALPGLRLGYSVMQSGLAKIIEDQMNPWSINSFADSASSYIFKDEDYIKKSISFNRMERNYLISELNKFGIFRVYDSKSNFILLKMENSNRKLFEFLLKNNLLIRLCQNFRGLDDRYIRIAVKSRIYNDRLLKLLHDYVNLKS
ncbi:MAG: histidinol-phosphate transaminase [Tissierellia bacterium]|nr:histidinol-phosphate transaminase [Tissierellia bacterium]